MIPLNINFLKSQPTIADLNKVVKEAQSPIKLQLDTARGDKFVEVTSKAPTESQPLQTLNYTKLNESRRNLEWQQAEKELGLIQL
jgi:hypothetical protein